VPRRNRRCRCSPGACPPPQSGFASKDEVTTLCDIPEGEDAVIVEIMAGRRLNARLSSMGIRPGKKVVKKTGFWRGPMTIEIDGTIYALRWGEAGKIIVKRK